MHARLAPPIDARGKYEQAVNATEEVRDEVSDYFRGLGFRVTWDYDKRDKLHWYEIYDETKMLVQIDFGVPLNCLLEDWPYFSEGRDGTSSHDYGVRGDTENFAAIYRRMNDPRR